MYLTREQEMQAMKAKSRGTDFSLGKNRSEDKRYEVFGSRRYYNEEEKAQPTSYSLF